jgi:hypothetical protein
MSITSTITDTIGGLLPAAEAAIEATERAEMARSNYLGHLGVVEEYTADERAALQARARRLIAALRGYDRQRMTAWAKAQGRGRPSETRHSGSRAWREPGTGPWRVLDAVEASC